MILLTNILPKTNINNPDKNASKKLILFKSVIILSGISSNTLMDNITLKLKLKLKAKNLFLSLNLINTTKPPINVLIPAKNDIKSDIIILN